MPLLTLDRVSLSFGHLPLFDGADLRVEPGERICLIGRNGAGKTSLLKVMSGETPPDGGSVWVISRLALPANRPMRELSGGWRRRALLGKALVSDPDLLLLDEPTNHLDLEAIRWLEEYLRTYSGALLFVTHDRALLSALATRIVELDRGRLTSWPGTYGSFLEKKAAALENEARELDRLDRKLAEEEAWLRQGVKARRTRNEGRVRALMALRARRAAHRVETGTARMALDSADASGRLVFEAKGVTKRYAGVPIVRAYSQRILRGDRIGLIGPNGAGKTTLLRLLVGELPPDVGEIRRGARLQVAYFDQQREQLDPDRSVMDSVIDGNETVMVNGQPRHVMGYLADFLFPRQRAQAPVKSLSGGERNRLMLARLFAKPANVLVMDEPTNDLDIETLELLEELIGAFDGTVLLVSHDRVFLENIVTSTLAFEGDGRVTEYVGGYEDYLRQSSRSGNVPVQPRDVLPPSDHPATRVRLPPEGRTALRRKLTFRERQELDSLPARVEGLEREQQRLQSRTASPDFYKEGSDQIRSVLGRLDAVGTELETALARWVELEEISRTNA
ncbi:MAG: ATP-binding cassette domain-containing protein [Acidobacteria bacterium]|nr:ATP-binding cassette domain-containing protein [Acidobacteriota bacterium]